MPTEISESGQQVLWVVIWAAEDTGSDMVSLTQVSSGHRVIGSAPIEVFNLGFLLQLHPFSSNLHAQQARAVPANYASTQQTESPISLKLAGEPAILPHNRNCTKLLDTFCESAHI